MSIKQMQAVFEDEDIKGNEKLLMLALADSSNDSGICFPNWNTLMKKTSMSKGSISKWLNILEEKKMLFRKSRNRKNGSRTSNKFLVYPHVNRDVLDEEDYLLFEDLYIQSSEVEPSSKVQELNHHGSEVEPSKGGQSSEVEHLEPSLNSNHQLTVTLKNKQKENFSFTLKQKVSIENTSAVYLENLKAYIESTGKPMSYEDFYNSCEMQGYKYKNFKTAYDVWMKKKSSSGTVNNSNGYKSKRETTNENIEAYFRDKRKATESVSVFDVEVMN
ncbi:MAG: helix-turn-helix domain-containing protein [Arcobacteraceae bacterium]